jgi:hypothetical protein
MMVSKRKGRVSYHVRFRVSAGRAEDKLLDEDIKELSEPVGIVGTVHNVAGGLLIHDGLGSKLKAKELGGVCR